MLPKGSLLDPPTGTTIALPKRPPKSAEEKEETIQKLEVRRTCARRLDSRSLGAPGLPV